LTTALVVLLWVAIGASVLLVVALVNRIGVATDIIDGRIDSDLVQRADDADGFVGLVVLLELALWLAIGVLTIVWTWRALKNHEWLGRYETRWTPGWGIAGWLIPFANLVIPVLIFQALWRGSDVETHRGAVERPRGSALVGWWWATWLASAVSGRFSSTGSDTGDPRDVRDADTLGAVGSAVSVAAALLYMQVLRKITQRQERCRAEALGANSERIVERGRRVGAIDSQLPAHDHPSAANLTTAEPLTTRIGTAVRGHRGMVVATAGVALLLAGAGIAVAVTSSGDDTSTKPASGQPAREAVSTSPSTTPRATTQEPVDSLPVEAALVDLPGFVVEEASSGVRDVFRQALSDSNDLPAGADVLALKRYVRDDGTDAQAYVVATPGTQLRRPVNGACFLPAGAGGEVVQLAGQDVCRQLFDSQWVLSWGPGDFGLRVLSTSPTTAEDLMTAVITANATP
jgi:hypothetical protein